MNNFRYSLISLILFLFSVQLSSQSFTQREAHRVNQANMQAATQAHRNFQNMNRMFQNMNLRMGNICVKKYQEKYKFNIVTLNGDTIIAKKKIKVSFQEPLKKLEIKDQQGNKIEFTPGQTREIFIKNSGKNIRGISYDDYWIFNTYNTDSIRFYAPFPEVDPSYISLYQVQGDTIKPLDKPFVEQLAQGNKKMGKALKKNHLHKALSIYLKEAGKKKKKSKE